MNKEIFLIKENMFKDIKKRNNKVIFLIKEICLRPEFDSHFKKMQEF